MHVFELIPRLKEARIVVELSDNNELIVSSPKGQLTADLIAQIKSNKNEFISFLQNNRRERERQIDPIAIQSSYALSHAQQRLWVLSQLDEVNAAYNMFNVYDWPGVFDMELLLASLDKMVNRHEILRTVFIMEDGEVRQRVLPSIALNIRYEDVSDFVTAEQEAALTVWSKEEMNTTFNLSAGPLLRGMVIKRSEARHQLLLTMHHIISDAWSMEVLIRELLMFYRGEQPVALRIQYKDYAQWQNELLLDNQINEHRHYWLHQFSGVLPVLDLPLDYPRPRIKGYHGSQAGIWMKTGIKPALESISRSAGCSMFTLLVASVKALLYRYTGQEDLVVGIPVAGRDHRDLEDQLGYYINTVALRSRFSGSGNFSDLLLEVKDRLLEGYAHQLYPFDRLVDDLVTQADRSRSPLFDVMINYEKRQGPQPETADEEEKTHRPQMSKFDLLFHFSEHDNGLRVSISYNTDLFKGERIDRMLQHYSTLLESLLTAKTATLDELNYIPVAEQTQLRAIFNNTSVEYNRNTTIHELLEAAVLRNSTKPALICEDRTLSYTAFNEAVNRVAHYLRNEHGITTGDRVGLMMDRTEKMVIGLYGILKAGGVYVPMDPSYPVVRLSYMLEDSAVKVLLTENSYGQSSWFVPVAIWEELQLDKYSSENPSVQTGPNDLLYIIYTSGSTGQPKGVMIEQHAVINLSNWLAGLIYNKSGAPLKVLLTASVNFDVSVGQLFAPLLYGASLVIIPEDTRINPDLYLATLQSKKINVLDITPSYLQLMIQLIKEKKILLPALQHILSAGEALPPDTALLCRAVLPAVTLLNAYGPTEACVYATFGDVAPLLTKAYSSISIGKPLPNYRIHILDKQQQETGIGIPGELCIAGEGLARGYWNRDELTNEKFIEHPVMGRLYRTGDMAAWTSEGEILFGGRRDDQVKIRGYRIELGEVERQVQSYSGVKEAVVMVKPINYEPALVAYIVWHEVVEVQQENALSMYLAKYLPAFMIPHHIVVMAALPKTPSGKYDRLALPSVDQKEIVQNYIAPQTMTEKQLVIIWEEVLQRTNIGISDNFFNLGGHSLKAMRMLSRVYQELHARISIRDVFATETVAGLATLIDSLERSAFKEIEPVAIQSSYALSHAQRRLWVLSQLDEVSAAYNMFNVYDWPGTFDMNLLLSSLYKLVDRHEILRTILIMEDGEARQRVLPSIVLNIRYEDISGLHPKEQESKLAAWSLAEMNSAFDLSAGPLLRGMIIKKSEQDHQLLLTMHHIISDAWSMEVLIRELLMFYRGETPGALRIQYKDYANWQSELLSGNQTNEHRGYWLQQLGGELPVLELPLDYPRPRIKGYNGSQASLWLPAHIKPALESLSRSAGCSMFTVLVATVKALLYRYTGQEDLIVGIPVAGRDHRDLEDQLGYYVNTVALRSRFSGENSFMDLLTEVKERLLEGYAHQLYPFDRLVDDLVTQADRSRSPLFDVMVSYQQMDVTVDQAATGITSHQPAFSKFDIMIDFFEYANGIQIGIGYNTDLFNTDRINRMLLHYNSLLQSLLQATGTHLNALNYLPEAEVLTLHESFNNTAVDYPHHTSIQEILEAQVLKTPDAPAVFCENRVLSYTAFNEAVNRIADYLRKEHGVVNGDRVGLMMDRTEKMLIGLYAIIKAGGVYVPLDPSYPAQRLSYMLEDSAVKVLLTEALYGQSPWPAPVAIWETLNPGHYSAVNPPVQIAPNDLLYIIYTSGSTGQPKGVMIEQRSVVNHTKWLSDLMYPSAENPLPALLTGSINFDASVEMLFPPLLNGASLEIIAETLRNDPQEYLQHIYNRQIAIVNLIPSHLHLLLQSALEQPQLFSYIKFVITGGEILQPDTIDLFRKISSKDAVLVNGYGPTETCVNASFKLIRHDNPVAAHTIGIPLPNYRVYILDQYQQETGIGIPGELCIAGEGLARGYWNRQELTMEKFINHPELGRLYRTGDIASWITNGEILFGGRRDDQVKIRGYRIELGEIERQVQAYAGVQEAVVIVKKIDDEAVLFAYIVWKADELETLLRAHLKEVLPAFMVPHRLITVDSIPRMPNGKLDRRNLPDTAGTDDNLARHYTAPQTETERQLVGIWEEVLNRTNVGITDNFFDLGGHSLKAMRMLSRVYQELGARISIRDVFATETVAAMAALVESLERSSFKEIEPVAIQSSYALSHAQRRLWVLSQLDEVSAAYNMFNRYDWPGNFDMNFLLSSLNQLVDRHEILRTVFIMEDGEPRQRVLPAIALKIRYEDITGIAPEEQESLLSQWSIEEMNASFDLATGPLLRGVAIKINEHQHQLLLTMHHIISDAWSMEVLIRELLMFYRGEKPDLLRVQYKDYANWQNELLSGNQTNEHRDYWLQQLGKEKLPVLELPLDYPRPRIKAYNGSQTGIWLPAHIKPALESLSRSAGCSMFTVLVATVKTLLYRYTGQQDIIVGIPVAGRDHRDLEDQLGYYVNTVALRSRFDGSNSFNDLLSEVKERLLEAYAHQLYPFDRLVDDLVTQADRSRSPIFDVMINYEMQEGAQPESTEQEEAHRPQMSKFDLLIHFSEYDNSIRVTATYNTDLFKATRIDRLLFHYSTLLESLLNDEAVSLDTLNYISAGEQVQINQVFNDTAADHQPDTTIRQLLEATVLRNGDAPALICEDRVLSYTTFNEAVNRVAHYLRKTHGVTVGDRVGLMMDRTENMVICLYGIIKAGAVYVPMDPSYPAQRIAYMLEDSAVKVLLTETLYNQSSWSVPVAIWEEMQLQHYSAENPAVQTGSNDLLYIIYTSGSTGQPKGVMIEQGSVVNLSQWLAGLVYPPSNPALRVLLTASINFDASVKQLFAPLFTGAALVIISEATRVNPDLYLAALQTYQVNVLDITPAYLHLLLQLTAERQYTFSALQCVLVGGENLQPQTIRLFKTAFDGAALINVYGPTEACVDSSFNVIDLKDESGAPGIIGRPVDNVQVYMLDKNRRQTGIGIPGELCIGGAGLARGYWNRETLTNEKFITHPGLGRLYCSGDLAAWTENGQISFLGRSDLQVKINGYRIELEEIDQSLLQFDGISEAVSVIAGSGDEKMLAAYIVWQGEEQESALRTHLLQYLPAYMVPRHIISMPALPRTPGGKYDRLALPAIDRKDKISHYIEPNTATERLLVNIWEEVLQRDHIGTTDNFFELGGHSLKAMRMLSRVYQELGARISIRDVFATETIAAMAVLVDGLERSNFKEIEPVAIQASYALSHAQRRLWVLSQLDEVNAAYNMFNVYDWPGAFDMELLLSSLGKLADRHEILRTVFIMEDGEARQQVLPSIALNIRYEDVSGFNNSAQESLLSQWNTAEMNTSFNLSAGPLLRGMVIKRNEHHHQLVLTMHHIISDAWSMDVLIRELLMFYRGEQPAALRIQYKDYAQWQNELLSGNQVNEHRHYWLQQFSGELPVLDLPLDYQRPRIKTYNGSQAGLWLPAHIKPNLEWLSRTAGCSMFTLLVASVKALLYRYTGQEDLVVGIPVAGRDHRDLEDQLGYYINTVALRSRFSGSGNFSDLLLEVKDRLLEGYAHQLYPFDRLVDDLVTQADRSRSPIFDVMINYEKRQGLQPVGATEDEALHHPEMSKFDLLIHFSEYDNGLRVSISYNTDLFKGERIDRMLAHYSTLLETLLNNENSSLDTLDYVPVHEKSTLNQVFNNTSVEYNRNTTIHELLEAAVFRNNEQPALICEDRTLSYTDFNEAVNRVAHYLRKEHGITTGDRVGLMMDRTENMVIALYGIIKAGGVYVPMDPSYPAARLSYMLEDSAVKVLLTENSYGQLSWSVPVAIWEELQLDNYSSENPSVQTGPDDLLYIIYTSGSTGQPKGVMIEQHAVINLSEWLAGLIYQQSTTPLNVLLTASINFDVSVGQLFAPLLYGASLVIISEDTRINPDLYLATLQTKKINVLDITPSYLQLMVQLIKEKKILLPALQHILSAGEALPPDTALLCRAALPEVTLINAYGPTEACVYASYGDVAPLLTKGYSSISIGKPLPNYRIHILDKQQQETGIGIPGELCIAGEGLARGYWNRDELTNEKFITHPVMGRLYRTGDMASWTSEGEILFGGRRDEQVKIRGYRIELGEIERQVQSYTAVKEAVVMVKPINNEPALVAYIVWHANEQETGLRAHIKEMLPAFMVPQRIIAVSSISRMPNGKLDRRSLPDIGIDNAAHNYTAPQTITEKQLAGIWEEVLQRTNIGTTDNFFDLGGHSLKAMRMLSRVYQEMHARISIRDVFATETVAGLATLIDSLERSTFKEIEPVATQSSYALSHAQRRLWILSQLEEVRAAYNMFNIYDWSGTFDIDLLQSSLNKLIDRHEILRTIFITEDGEVRQQVLPSVALNIRYEDLSGLCTEEQELEFSAWSAREINTAFDLSAGPLLQGVVIKRGEHHHQLLFTMHHIISDAWSMEVLIRELLMFYRDEAPGALRIQYKDYANWQNELLSGNQAGEHQSYWLQQLGGELPVLELPLDYPRPHVKGYNGSQAGAWLKTGIKPALESLSRSVGCSMFTVLVATVKVLLYRYTGQEDLIVGIPVAGRDHRDLEDQLGYYVNTVALRSRFNGGNSFMDLLTEVKERLLEGYAHQLYPFDRLVDDLVTQADRSRSPLFDVMINYEKQEGLQQESMVSTEQTHRPGVSKFDLVFNFIETGDGLNIDIVYNTGLFKPDRISRMLAHYSELVESIIHQTGAALHSLPYIPAAEMQLVIQRFNDTGSTYQTDLPVQAMVEQQAIRRPAAIAVLGNNHHLTYDELNKRSNRLARYLQEQHGVASGSYIGIVMDRSAEMLITMLGILKAGAAYVPIDPATPAQRLDYIIEDGGLSLLITTEQHQHPVVKIILWESLSFENYSDKNLPLQNTSTDICYVIYTSGSTGKPKGVMIKHHSLINLCQWHIAAFGVDENSKASLYAGVGFDAAVWETWPYLCAGAAVYPLAEATRHHLPELIKQLQQVGITHSFFPTPVCEELVKYHIALDPDWYLLTGGDRLTNIEGLTARVVNNYGPTETTVVATSMLLNRDNENKVIPIGKPIANTQIYILDKFVQPVAIGVAGELYIAGDGVSSGYVNNKLLTEERFVSNPYKTSPTMFKTGDLGRWLPDGSIEFLGRSDSQVKIRGHRIELTEIERAIHAIKEIDECKVMVITENGESQLVAFYTGIRMDNNVIKQLLEQWLPYYMLPSCFVCLESLPLTLNGKLDQSALKELAKTNRHTANIVCEPNTATEAIILAIWKEVLATDNIGIHENFFELGGHSLKAIRIKNAIEKQTDKKVSLRDIFNYPTITALSAFLDLVNTTEAGLSIKLNKALQNSKLLYMIPPIIGSATIYQALAGSLQGVYHCIGLQYPGFDNQTAFADSIETLAAFFTKEILQNSTAPEICLLGYSLGSWVAFEIAKQLENAGRTVCLIVVDKAASDNTAADIELWENAKEQMPEALLDEVTFWMDQLQGKDREQVLDLVKQNYNNMKKYQQTGNINGRIITVHADQKTNTSQQMETWEPYTTAACNHYAIESDHYQIIHHPDMTALLLNKVDVHNLEVVIF